MAVATDPGQAMQVLLKNRKLAIETLLEIEDKNRQLVPMKLSPIQADMLETSGSRDIYVKPGQIGATSLWVGDYLLDNLFINGTVSCIVSYDEFSAQRLLIKAKKFYRNLKTKIPTIPKLDHKSATELSFEYQDSKVNFYSVFYIFSARSYTLGRGEAIHNLLLDEYAFWPEGTHQEVFASAQQRVPLLPNTNIKIQSTANGEDNPFCVVYKAARERQAIERAIYKPHFYEWYRHPEYQMLPDSDFCLLGDDVPVLKNLASDEQTLLTRFENLGFTEEESHNKLRWRRYKIDEMRSLRTTGDTAMTFPQEYPEDDTSCFLTSGNQAYDADIIAENLRKCYPAPIHHHVVGPKGTSAGVDIWFDKEDNLGYILAIDPGKGKTSESVGHVWTFKEGYKDKEGKDVPPEFKHCATLAGFYDEAEMAEFCMELGRYYNEAVIAPEDNLDIVSHLRNYPQLYYREDPRGINKTGRAIGWQTNTSTKPYMITELNRNLEYIVCHDARFWSQLSNIKRSPSSKSGILVTGPDDHHDTGAIAIVCRTAMPVQRGYVGSYGWDENWGK